MKDTDWRSPVPGTGRALSPLLFTAFLDTVPAHVAILDADGRVVRVNAAWRRFSMENGGSDCCGVGADYLSVCLAAEDRDARTIADGLQRVMAGQAASFEHEYPCHGNGYQRWFRCLVSPMPSEDGNGTGGAAVIHIDISAAHMAEQRAIEANRAKTEFLASMSHELRTPLNAIIGFSEMLMLESWGPLGNPRYRGYAEDIHSAGAHLLSLINEVLDLAKVEAGHYELHDERVPVAELLTSCLNLVSERAANKGQTLACHVLDGVDSITADPRLLRQILLNLLSNAVKFTPEGGAVSATAARTEEGNLRLTVTDTGIGIAAADLERVMQPFGQVDSELARKHSGESTGLGLPLVKRFVELHGGHLELTSTPDSGTSVSAVLPAWRCR